MVRLGLETDIVDRDTYDRSLVRLAEVGVALPTFGELAEPARIPEKVREALAEVDPDEPHPLNLYRVHWYMGEDRRRPAPVPAHLVLPEALTGVPARIVVLLGDRFPMIRAHKVLAAYGCLAPAIITGQFDPAAHKALWPSTGNYCRGGVAISRIMGCRGVAILPEGMSAERFEWLGRWVAEPADVIRTPGSESNVKEIYDECARLDRDPAHVIFNQFCEFGNHLVHWLCTGKAAQHVFETHRAREEQLQLRAFVAATGSAGTLGAGDWLAEHYGACTVAVEAAECPTLLENGFGEHNIQGIGDKHVPFIHNVMATDVVAAVSDRSTDALQILLNTDAGRDYLCRRRGLEESFVRRLSSLGLSGICNVLAAIKVAKHFGFARDDVILTVATDGAELYRTEQQKALARDFPGGFDEVHAAEVFGQHLLGVATDRLRELTHEERRRIFNLGYFTWVEQQGVSVEEFTARRDPPFWRGLQELIPAWDARIEEFNARSGVLAAL